MAIKLKDHQTEAIKNLQNGSILCGGTGSGKSITSLAYYFLEQGGKILDGRYSWMKDPKDLYIITTARKRDECEWEGELSHFLLSTHPEINSYKNKVVVDSWNNISKYVNVTNAFFIFDEQRVVGSGEWVKSFLKITKSNNWILLSATPGDTWQDYIPVFIANGFYKNKTEFIREHVIYSRFSKFPKVDRYINTGRLIRLRNKILVDMDYEKHTIPHHIETYVDYNPWEYKKIFKDKWNPSTNSPIKNASEMCYELRKIVNSDYNRQMKVIDILTEHPRAIIFYNFNYELEILKELLTPLTESKNFEIAEWNGHKHQPIPETKGWAYLVQYNAGAEGWNCIKTDTIIFFSQNYSYKVMVQSAGRIDRLNTPYTDLYFYHLKSRSGIDLAISKALKGKKKFNEQHFAKEQSSQLRVA